MTDRESPQVIPSARRTPDGLVSGSPALPSAEELQVLLEARTPVCLSIYLPLGPAGDRGRTGPVRLRNALRDAEEILASQEIPRPEVTALLDPLRRLAREEPFWRLPGLGLVLFREGDALRLFRLPCPAEHRVVVGRRFHLKPLVRAMSGRGCYHLLALSSNQVRLFAGDETGLRESALGEIPARLDEVGGDDRGPRSVQVHTRSSGRGPGGGRDGAFHGPGAPSDARDKALRQFLLAVERGLRPILAGAPQRPLVLAAVGHLHAAFRHLTNLPTLLAEGIYGNPDDRSPEELHQLAWDLLAPQFAAAQGEARRRYEDLVGPELRSARLEDVLRAAAAGQVETLFATADRTIWGRFDPALDTVQLREDTDLDTEDLVDRAAVETLRHGGTVFVLPEQEIPEEAPLAAIFRYPRPEPRPEARRPPRHAPHP